MREHITDILDAAGLAAVAVGVGAGAAQWIGWFGAAVGGLVLIGGSMLAHARSGGERR